MSRVPDDIPGLGKASDRLRQNPAFDPGCYDFERDSYFVWSRLDGYTSTRDVILMVGFDVTHTLGILDSLRAVGAILRPGEKPEDMAQRVEAARRARAARIAQAADTAASTPRLAEAADRTAAGKAGAGPSRRARSEAAAPVLPEPLEPLTPEEQAAMAADVDLDDDLKRRILSMRRKAAGADYFALLEVTADTDRRELKRIYFRLSKEFHPDRYYRKNTGPFGPWLAAIFETLSRAFEVLSDDTARKRYLASVTGEHDALKGHQSREEYARDLFDRACTAETSGDTALALKLFAAAVRVHEHVRYLGRAALCATAAGELAVAEEYARKAAALEPQSPSVARILAGVCRAAGKLAEAEDILVHALSLKSENDVLGKELAADLGAVRAARARARSPSQPEGASD